MHFYNAEEVAVAEEIVEEISIENANEITLPHPFATALLEYKAGYDGVVRAYLATLDDNGTMGVLTTRPTTRILWDYDYREYHYGNSGMLFYIQDDELFQIDVSGGWWLFVAGRYNRLMSRHYAHTHIAETIWKLEFGRLETSMLLSYFSDEYLSFLFDNDYGSAEQIAYRDERTAYAGERYGLVAKLSPDFGHMRNTECQTAQILAMTINCVPYLHTSICDYR